MDVSTSLRNKPNRKDVLDLAIGLVQDKFGSVRTYEELVALLQREFPEQHYTLDEVIEFYLLSIESAELCSTIYHTNYGNGSLYQYHEAY